jgi:hypothetical protein
MPRQGVACPVRQQVRETYQVDLTVEERQTLRTYAQPLSGLQVSWGSILAGTLTILASSLIQWALCLAVISTATNLTLTSLRISLIALWICTMATTLIGSFIGGGVAAYLPGNIRPVVYTAHALLAWALAFLLFSALQFGIIRSVARTAAFGAVATATAVSQPQGAQAAAAGGPTLLEQRVQNFLMSMGYSQAQAQQVAADVRARLQQASEQPGGAQPVQPAGASAPLQGLLRYMIGSVIGLSWSWFGTWLLAGLLALLGGRTAMARVTRRLPEAERRALRERRYEGGIFGPTPTHT